MCAVFHFSECIIKYYKLQSASLVPNVPLPQGAPGEIKLVISRSASPNLASVFNYNGRSAIIGIMRRKRSTQWCSQCAVALPIFAGDGLFDWAVCAVKNTVGDTTSLQPPVLFRLISIGQ